MRGVLALSKPGRHSDLRVPGTGANCPLQLSSSTPYLPPPTPRGSRMAGLCSQNTASLENEACDLKPFYISELNADIITTLSSPTVCPHSHRMCVCVYGSDFPYMTPHFSLYPVKEADISEEKKQKILAGTARKIFPIK